jgi:hypothetical protein
VPATFLQRALQYSAAQPKPGIGIASTAVESRVYMGRNLMAGDESRLRLKMSPGGQIAVAVQTTYSGSVIRGAQQKELREE